MRDDSSFVSTSRGTPRASLVCMDGGRPESRRTRAARRDRSTSIPTRDAPAPDATDLAAEQNLVERAKQDMEAFSELYRHYLPRVHAFAWRRTGDTQAAEDICAATFEAAMRGLPSFTWRRGGFAPWLFRIAANQTVGHHRREGRAGSERGQRAMASMFEPAAAGPDIDLIAPDNGGLREALDRLHPRYQRAIALRYLAELGPDEAASAMELAKPAFAVVLSRALKALRRELERSSPGTPDRPERRGGER